MNPFDYVDVIDDPLRFLTHEDEQARWLAVSACTPRAGEPEVADALRRVLEADPAPRVRAEAAEALGAAPAQFEALMRATADPDSIVREAVATAFGEHANDAAVPWLIDAACGDPDKLVREASIAALGAIGDPAVIPVLHEILGTGGPQLRRRAVVALSVFDEPGVEEALRAAAHDRNPMVREAAEMIVGRPTEWEPVELKRPDER